MDVDSLVELSADGSMLQGVSLFILLQNCGNAYLLPGKDLAAIRIRSILS